MSKWFYYNEQGKKFEVTGGQLKWLAKNGQIAPDTIVETEEGKKARAEKVKGLAFIATAQPETSVFESAAPETENRKMAQPEPLPPPVNNPFSDLSNPFNPSASIPMEQSPFASPAHVPATPMGSLCTYCGQPVHPTAAVCMACGTNPRSHRKFCYACSVPMNEMQIMCTKCHTPVGGNIGVGNVPIDALAVPRQRVTYVLLAVFILGAYGVHNFYAGRKSQAIAQLIIGLLGAVLTAGIVTLGVWAWAIIEAITVNEDGDGRPMV